MSNSPDEENKNKLAVPSTLPLKKPDWLKVRAPGGDNYLRIKDMLGDLKLATVCQEATWASVGVVARRRLC